MDNVLEAVNAIMDELGLNYEFQEWSGEDVYPYWTMEFLGNYHTDESGRAEHYPTLTGHSIEEGDDWGALWDEVEMIREKLKRNVTYRCEDGGVVTIGIQDILSFPSQIPTHKTVDISLSIRTWEVD